MYSRDTTRLVRHLFGVSIYHVFTFKQDSRWRYGRGIEKREGSERRQERNPTEKATGQGRIMEKKLESLEVWIKDVHAKIF